MTIYFIQETLRRSIKIGYTAGDPLERMKQLQSGNPDKFILLKAIPGTMAQEQELHSRFDHLNIRNEWFKPGKSLLNFIGNNDRHVPEPYVAKIINEIERKARKEMRRLADKAWRDLLK